MEAKLVGITQCSGSQNRKQHSESCRWKDAIYDLLYNSHACDNNSGKTSNKQSRRVCWSCAVHVGEV